MADQRSIDDAALDRCLDENLDDGFSGVVAVAQGADVVAWRAFRLANRAEAIPNELGTRFQVASGSKLLTSIAVCQLVDDGGLDLDTRLVDCVNRGLLGRLDQRITIRQLLTHTSGITSYFEEDVDDDYEALWRDLPVYRIRGPRDFLPLFVDKPMRFPPGERFDYNDAGFILLGVLIEEVTGRPFGDHVRDAVITPAGMTNSGYFAADQLPPRTALAYIADADGGWRTNVFAVPIVGSADGGAYATAPDLARLWTAFTSRRLVSEAMTTQMLRPQIATGWEEPHKHYGLGVWHTDKAGGYHFVEGADPGVAMISAHFPAQECGVTLLANADVPVWRTFQALVSLLVNSPE